MMRRNRKKNRASKWFLPAGMAAVVVAGLALLHVWLGVSCEKLGRNIQALEKAQGVLDQRLQTEEAEWAILRSPKNLEAALARMNIQMAFPQASEIVRLDNDDFRNQQKGWLSEGVSLARMDSMR